MAELEEILPKCQTVYDEGIKVLQDMTGWTKIDSGNEEVTCFRRPNDTDFDTFKAELFAEKPPRATARFVFENWTALNMELNEQDMESIEVVKSFNDDAKLYFITAREKGIVSSRTFLVGGIFLDLGNDTFAIVGTSVEDPAFPNPEGKVRGEVRLSVTLYEPAAGDANRAHVQAVSIIDPKGSVPAAIVNSVLGNRAKFYAGLKDRINSNA
jgi:hypothetical protein